MKKHLQFIASFLIVLILNMQFYAISVYAAINKLTVKGGDGFEDYVKANDFLTINAQASISGDTITNDQLILGTGLQFDKCTTSLNNGSDCTSRFPPNGTESFEAKSVPFTVNLFKDDKTLDDSKTGTVTVDNKAPQVTLSASQSKFSSQQNVVIDYEVIDFACDDSSCNNKCVGIKSIEFYTQNSAFKQTVNPAASDCSVKSSITIDPKTFNDGLNSVFAKAVDKFNQVSPETSVTFTVDSSAPSIVANSFEILRKGISISAFSTAGINVDVVVNISGNDLDLNSVKADLSALNPNSNLKNAKASCTSLHSSLSVCKWAIELNPETAGLKAITINVADKSSNKESATINKFLALDDKGPVVQSLSTATEKEGQVLAKASGNTVIAVFEEVTGLSVDEVFLHVGKSRIKATRCSKETNWVCVWENVNFNPVSQMSIEADSTDVLGNSVSQDAYVGITIDKSAPVLQHINISPVGGLVPAFPGFAKIGDKISVVANLTEDNDVFAVADFSKFITDASAVAGSCERIQADEHLCTWQTDAINLESSSVITFNFSDNAGNALIVTKSFKTFGLENATVPDFWGNTVLCSPRTVDRQLGPLINQRVYCQVNLKQKSSTKAVSTVFIGPATCSGDSGIVQNVETLNAESGSTSPFIKVTLKKSDFNINKADLSCSFSIFSKIGSSTSITKNPEVENAKITLEFFNNPLGELASNVEKDIKNAKEEAQGIWEFIGTLNKLVFWAKKICGLINTVYNVFAALYNVVILFTSLDVIGEKTPGFLTDYFTFKAASISSCGFETTGRVVTAQATNKGLNWACSIVNCKQAYLWGPYVQDFINNAPGLPGRILSPGRYVGTPTTLEGDKWYNKEVKIADQKGPLSGYIRPVSEYMDPNNNIIVAGLFACLPGVIYGLDKYRQILCLHADCMKNAVGKEGLPLFACDDLKGYQTCKYLTSELFAVFPWTAVIDYFLRLIKNSLSNPLTVLGPLISELCSFVCSVPAGGPRLVAFKACETVRLFSQIGSIAQDVKNIIDEGFKVRQDYCSRIDDDDEEDDVKKTDATGKK